MDENTVMALLQIKDVDRQTHRALRTLAAAEGKGIGEFLRELLDKYVAHHRDELPKSFFEEKKS